MQSVLREEPVDDDLQHDNEETHEDHLSAHEGVGGVTLKRVTKSVVSVISTCI